MRLAANPLRLIPLLLALHAGLAPAAPASVLAQLPQDTASALRETLGSHQSAVREALQQRLGALQDALDADARAKPAADGAQSPGGAARAAAQPLLWAGRASQHRADFSQLRAGVQAELATLQAQVQAVAGPDRAADVQRLQAQVAQRFDRLDMALLAVEQAGDPAASTQARQVLGRLLAAWRAPQLQGSAKPVPTLSPMRPLLRAPGQGVPSTSLPRYAHDSLRTTPLAQAGDGPQRLRTIDRGEGVALVRAAATLPPVAADTGTDCGAVAADLADDGVEVQLSAEVRALAQQLQYSPVRILAWLQKEVAFEPYWGSLKGGLGVLQTRAGNATDQSSLLVALLRASNVPARFVRGTVALNDMAPADNAGGRAQRWLATQNYSASVAYLSNSGGVPGGPYSFNGSTTGISFDHVWVQACVPFAAYRGSRADGGGYRWVPLDASIKDHDYQAGLAVDLPLDAAFYADFLARRSSQLPPDFLADRTETAARALRSDASAEDVPYRGTRRVQRLDVLPSVTPFAVTQFSNWPGSSSAESATIPDAHRHRLTVAVKNAAGTTLASDSALYPQTALQRVTVSYRPNAASQALWSAWGGALSALPAGSVSVYPVIQRDGVVVASGSAGPTLALGATHSVVMKLTQGEEVDGRCINDNGSRASPPDPDASCLNKTVYENVRAGAYYAMGINARQMSDALLNQRAAVLAEAVRSNPSAPTPASGAAYDATVGELLHLVLQNYLLETERADGRIAALRGFQSVGNYDIGLTGSDLKTDHVFDLPLTVKPSGVYIDFKGGVYGFARQATAADFSASRQATLDTEQRDLAKLSIYAGSALEHHVWQQALRTDAISTVRGLQYAAETGVPLVTLTSANIGQYDALMQMTGATSMAGFKAALQAEVAAGASVTVPRAQISYSDPVEPAKAWRGAVYMSENTGNGSYGAIIAGGISGGYPLLNSTPYGDLWGPNANQPGFLDRLANGLGRLLGLPPGTQGSNPLASWLGDPVNMLTGNLTHNERDLAIKGRGGLPIVLERWYNSGDPQDGPLGFGWTHSFAHQLRLYGVEGGSAKVGWFNGSGGETFYATTAHTNGDITRGSTLANPAGATVAFTRVAGGADDGRFRIRERNGLVYLFAAATGPATVPAAGTAVVARLLSVTDRNGNRLTLNYSGNQLASVADSLGRSVLVFSWTGSRITQVSDYSGRSVRYAYTDGNGHLNAVTDAAGQLHGYTYFGAADGARLNHKLRRHTLPRGNGMEFAYHSGGQVMRHTAFDTDGSPIADGTIRFFYDTFNREAWSVNERGHTHRFSFDTNGNPQRITAADGAEHSYSYDTARPHNRLSETDAVGRTTRYTYDAQDLVTSITQPSGAVAELRDYTAFAQPQRVKDVRGHWRWMRYDSRGNLTDAVALRAGVAGVAGVQPAAADMRQWLRLSHDAVGNLVGVTRVANLAAGTGPTVLRNFDASGLNLLSLTRTGNRSGALVNETSSTFTYDSLNRLTQGVDSRWYPVRQAHDALDRLTLVTDALGKPRELAYDPNGNLRATALVEGGVRLDSSAAEHDGRDRLTARLDHAGNLWSLGHDATGNLVRQTSPDNHSIGIDHDPADRPVAVFNEAGHRLFTDLDTQGRPLTVTDPNGHTTHYQYWGQTGGVALFDGRLRRITQPAIPGQPGGRALEFDYDEAGQVSRTRVLAADGGSRQSSLFRDELGRQVRSVGMADDSGNRLQVCTRYDALSNPTEVWAGPTTDTSSTSCNFADASLKRQVSWAWDDFGNKLTSTDALGRVWTDRHDLHGNLVSRQSPEQAKVSATTRTTYAYDPTLQGLLQSRTVPGAGAAGQQLVYTRNALGQVLRAETRDGSGALVVAYDYGYDVAHRLASIADSRGNQRLRYTWTPGGRLGRVELQDGGSTTHAWDFKVDAVGRLSAVVAPNGQTVTLALDAGGRLLERIVGDTGIASSWRWHPEGSLESVSHRSGSTVQASHVYSHDLRGNRSSVASLLGGAAQTVNYGYDALDRLTRVANGNAAQDEAYVFDIFGNRTGKTLGSPVTSSWAHSHDAAHQLTQVQQTTGGSTSTTALLRHDDNGNLRKLCEGTGVAGTATDCSGSRTTTLVWDGLDQLASLAQAGTTVLAEAYAYDDSGRRIRKTSGGSSRHYLYDGYNIAAEWSGASLGGAPTAAYAHAGLDAPLMRLTGASGSPDAAAAYYAQDGIGSVRALLSAGTAANQVAQTGNSLVTTGDYSSAVYPASQLRDGVTTVSSDSGWVGLVPGGAAATLGLGAGSTLERVELMAVNGYQPSAWVVESRNADNSWTQVASGTAADFATWSDGSSLRAVKSFAPVATTALRVRITASVGGDFVWLTEWQAWSTGGSALTQSFDAWGQRSGGGTAIPTYGYAGREGDASGLHYNRARYYLPAYGRFASRDPIGLAGGINPYAYADGNPVSFNDPDGLLARRVGNTVSDYWGRSSDYLGRSFDQLIRGNYTDNVTGLGTGMQIGTGILGVDLPGDIRDITHDLQNWKWSWEHAGKTALDAAGILPVVGAIKYGDEANALLKGSNGAPTGGRLGNQATRDHVDQVATEMEGRGWTVTHGGGRGPEEYLPGPGGGRSGSSYPDITATKDGNTLRVNTVDTRADGVTPSTRESINADRIRAQTGGHVLLVPKPKP